MRGKKITNHHQFCQQPAPKKTQTKLAIKQRINDIRSLQQKYKPAQHQTPLPTHKNINIQQFTSATEYDMPKRQRQALKYVPIGQAAHQKPKINSNQHLIQRNTEARQFLHNRENNLMTKNVVSPQQRSQQRIKVFSAQVNDKSWSRSENSSAKKRTGIQLTKTLLKRISGMYADKDFQNKSSYVNKTNKQQTTGMTSSGRGVYDQYQISDFDLLGNNHTINTSNHNHLSFNDSGNWNKHNDSQKRITYNQTNHENLLKSSREQEKKLIQYSKQMRKLQKMRSYETLSNSRPLSQSIEVGEELPARHQLRRCQFASPAQNEKYLIHSKGKTLQQLSTKQSMVIGFDNYYQ